MKVIIPEAQVIYKKELKNITLVNMPDTQKQDYR